MLNQHPPAPQDKFSHEAVVQPAKIKKGKTRWNQCHEGLTTVDPDLLTDPILDFGSGVGYFVLEGLRRNLNIWGVDILAGKIRRYHNLIKYTSSPEHWKKRCLIGDGSALPFPANHFGAVISWFVFEHIPNTGEVLRELVRITKPGGILILRAQDARCTYEGHCKIPWIPFLREDLALAWMDEFDKSPALRENVFAITQPQVASILETLGCSIIKQDNPLPPLNPLFHECHSEEKVRSVARYIKTEFESGRLKPRQDGLYLYAQKSSC